MEPPTEGGLGLGGSVSVPLPPPLPQNLVSTSPQKPETVSAGSKRYQKEMQFRLVGAIEQRDLTKVSHLIESGVNIDCTILYAKTPLIHAIEQGYDEVAELLLNSGASFERAETIAWQRRPLHMAVLKNSTFMVEQLLRRGAKVDGRDGCGMTPLHHACFLGYKTVVEMLLAHEASLCLGDYVQRDALHRAMEGRHLEIAQLLVDMRVCVNGADSYGWTPLYQCVMCNDLKGTRFLLSRGADVKLKDSKGDTPLHVACDRFSRANIRTMLSTSVDFYRRMRRIPTSDVQQLLQKDRHAELEMVDLLVNSGSEVNAINDFMTRPIHVTRDPHVVKYLIACGACIDYDMVIVAYRFGGDRNLAFWMDEQYELQTKLVRLCRRWIRTHLQQTKDIKEAVNKLPLPQKLIDFLNLAELQD